MKKIYLLTLLCCFAIAAQSQTTVTLWAASATTYKTGYATSTGSRVDNTIMSSGTTAPIYRGYAVFDLSTIPAGSTVNSVVIGFYNSGYGGAGVPSGWNTYGYVGDLSTVTVAATLYADMVAGTNINTNTYGTGVGNQVLPTTAAAQTFVQTNEGGLVSICWTGGANRIYTISGRTGSTASTSIAGHAPYMMVTYCPPPTAVTATAAPNPLCQGDVLTLTGSATGATGYTWTGPSAYSSTLATSTLTTTAGSAGVYTVTAINSCGTFSSTATGTTAAVTVNPLPSAITGAPAVCVGSATTLSSLSGGGTWTSSNPAIATIGASTGLVNGMSAGTVTITYTLSTGCMITAPMTVNDPPDPISGPTEVCELSSITLADAVTGGTWTTGSPGIASVGASTGIVTGVGAGTATISYFTGGCTAVTYDVTVDPLPSAIAGSPFVCEGQTTSLTDGTAGGNWSSSNITIAMVGSTGIVTGVAAGTANIIYTLPTTGCQVSMAMVVNANPSPIAGPSTVCEGATMTLTDPTPGGGFSGGAPTASVTFGGVVTGITAGSSDITYTVGGTGCYTTTTILVNSLPAAITGTLEFCQNTTTTLSDSDPGGTWSSAAPGIAAVGSYTGVVSGIATPGTTITYTLGTGCYSTADVTVDPAPSGLVGFSGPTTFCAGNSVTLTASGGAGDLFQWSNTMGAISGATNISYVASVTDTYYVTVTNTFNCSTTSGAVGVTAGFTATIDYSTPLHFCIGSSVVLTADAGAAVGSLTYQWLMNGFPAASGTSASYIATMSGVYSCIVNISGSSGSCSDTTAPDTVVVNPLPTPVIVNTGGTLVTTTSYPGYQWYLNSIALPGANSASYVPHANGLYRVRVIDAIGCGGYSNGIEITGVGVAQVNSISDVKVYPNPANDVLHIESPFAVSAIVTSIEGKQLIVVNSARDINISSLATGVYLLQLYNGSGERLTVQKLIKE